MISTQSVCDILQIYLVWFEFHCRSEIIMTLPPEKPVTSVQSTGPVNQKKISLMSVTSLSFQYSHNRG